MSIAPLGGPVVPLEHGASYARPQRTEQQASNAAGDRRLSLTLAKEEARGCHPRSLLKNGGLSVPVRIRRTQKATCIASTAKVVVHLC